MQCENSRQANLYGQRLTMWFVMVLLAVVLVAGGGGAVGERVRV